MTFLVGVRFTGPRGEVYEVINHTLIVGNPESEPLHAVTLRKVASIISPTPAVSVGYGPTEPAKKKVVSPDKLRKKQLHHKQKRK